MSNATIIRPVAIEPREDLVRAATQAAMRIAERAPEADRNRRVPVENIRDLHDAGLLTVAIPADLGGTEADLVTQIAVYQIIGGACASTAWVMGNHSVLCNRALGMMGEGAHSLLKDVVKNGSLISHAAIPGGDTKPAPGGFIASGRWPFVSGSNISTWMFLSTMVDGDNRWMLMPTTQPGPMANSRHTPPGLTGFAFYPNYPFSRCGVSSPSSTMLEK